MIFFFFLFFFLFFFFLSLTQTSLFFLSWGRNQVKAQNDCTSEDSPLLLLLSMKERKCSKLALKISFSFLPSIGEMRCGKTQTRNPVERKKLWITFFPRFSKRERSKGRDRCCFAVYVHPPSESTWKVSREGRKHSRIFLFAFYWILLSLCPRCGRERKKERKQRRTEERRKKGYFFLTLDVEDENG